MCSRKIFFYITAFVLIYSSTSSTAGFTSNNTSVTLSSSNVDGKTSEVVKIYVPVEYDTPKIHSSHNMRKGPTMFKRHHTNTSVESIHLMDEGVLVKNTYIPIMLNNSLINSSAQNNTAAEKSPINGQKENNSTQINKTNEKTYRVMKIKKNSIQTGGNNTERNQRSAFSLFKIFPNMLSMLPAKLLPIKQQNETVEPEIKTEDERTWSKIIPPQVTENTSIESIAKQSEQRSEKIKKLLNLFTVVKFNHEECHAEGIKGICMDRSECETKEGQFATTCATEHAVCCYYSKSCGQTSKENLTYFVNEEFPESSSVAPYICTLTVEKADRNVKQIRLDFLDFKLRNPINGTCLNDRFVVSGQDTNDVIPEICGINTGQHIYMDAEDSTGPFILNVVTMGEYFLRHFRIKVTQLRQGDDLMSPKNCLQYHTEPTGIVQSFNYEQNIDDNPDEISTGYFNNLNYAICIKKVAGFCSISYENEDVANEQITFQLLNVDEDGEELLPPNQAGAETFDCPDDYIIINGIRLCGEKFNDASVDIDFTKNYPVTDTSPGPFILLVRTDSAITGRGFYLNYKQNSCLA